MTSENETTPILGGYGKTGRRAAERLEARALPRSFRSYAQAAAGAWK